MKQFKKTKRFYKTSIKLLHTSQNMRSPVECHFLRNTLSHFDIAQTSCFNQVEKNWIGLAILRCLHANMNTDNNCLIVFLI